MALDELSEIGDEELLLRYAGGDKSAARSLTLRLTPRVLAHAYRMLGDRAEAEDIAQEAMLRLWNVAADWRVGEAKVTTWLYRVVGNLCTDQLRKRRAVPLEDAPEPLDDAMSAPDRLMAEARAKAVMAALKKLPERQRRAVILRHFEGLSNPDIAEVMGIGVEAVESLTARGKRALKAALMDEKETLGVMQ